jgi:hypothetical protein
MTNIDHTLEVEILKYPNKRYLASMLFSFIINIILFFIFLSFNLFSQQTGTGYSESYVLRDIGSRAISLGGAYTAISNDPTTIFYNPAGLSSLSENATLLTSVSSIGVDRYFTNFAFGQALNENFGIGFGINSLTSPEFISRNNRGQEIRNLIDLQYNMSLGIAYRKESVSIGVAAKYFKHNLQMSGIYANGFGIDVGTKFNVLETFSFGASAQNLGGNMIWNSSKNNLEAIPYRIRTGVAWEMGFDDEKIQAKVGDIDEVEEIYVPASKYLLFSLDGQITQNHRSPSFIFGAEAIVHEYLGFRGGITIYGEDNFETKFLPMNNWALGVTIRPNIEGLPFGLNIDYSVAKEYLIQSGISHNVTVFFEIK